MSVKILSQSGAGLADIYDVEGSVAGIEQLESKEVTLVHEMGAEIFSERLRTFMAVLDSTAILQSVAFNITLPQVTTAINRVLGITVMMDVAGRIDFCSLAIQDVITEEEMPIWSWDLAIDLERQVRWSNAGAAVLTFIQAVPITPAMLPYLLTETGEARRNPAFIFRGISSAFGAGNARARCLITQARAGPATTGPPSSRGLPCPSW